ncbi:MAG: AMP-binding protein, partial [Flavobacteriaceae bacterium]
MDTLSSALRKSARSYPDLNAIVSASGAITFRELDQRVDRLAAGLLQLGVSRGDNVALWLPNCQEWIELFCACARIGAVTVPVNIRYKAEEAAYVISHSDAKLLVIAHQSGGTDYYEALISVAPELANQEQEAGALQLTAMSQLRTVVVVGDDR